jgi:hypothetical protein
VLPQPAAIKIVADFAKHIGAAKFFDAGDVQANGFQIVEDDRTGDTFTEAGASYMGFAASALLGSALATEPRYAIAFCGDGSFMMNPQILIDAVAHGVRGMIVIFDNRRMAAITGLQQAQYGAGFATSDDVAVDYVRLAASVEGVKAVYGGETRASLEPPCAQPMPTTASRSSTSRSISAPTTSPASAPGASGTSATGAKPSSAAGSSRTCACADLQSATHCFCESHSGSCCSRARARMLTSFIE